MKNIFSLLLTGISLLSITSCSDADYNEKYQDPSTTTTVSVPQLFTGVMFKGNVWMNMQYYRYYTQSSTSGLFSGVVGDNNEKGRYLGATEGYFNSRWKEFYDMLAQYRLLQDTYEKLSEKEKKINEIFVHLSRALIYSQLHEVISLWGDVPFKGAGYLWKDGNYDEAKKKCVYDDDEVLYKMILSDLKDSGDFLNGSIDNAAFVTLSRQDYTIAAGDKIKWQKYINSLRLRIALHLASNGNCVKDAHNAISELLNNTDKYPMIDNNSDNMGVTCDNQKDDFNYGKVLSNALHTGKMGSGSVTMLKAMNLPENGVPDSNTDPRIQVMYDCNPDGEYVAFDIRKLNADISKLEDEKRQEYLKRGLGNANYYCKIDSQAVMGIKGGQGNENIFSLWISAAEVSLSKSEAYLMGYGVAKNEAKSKECFVKGVTQSVEFYWNQKEKSTLYKPGNDSDKGFRKLVRPSYNEVQAYIDKIWEPSQEVVCTQLWLNFGYMNELEAWNVVRRTGFPNLKFTKDEQVSNYPTPPNRLPYTSDELSYNSENCKNAIDLNYEESTGYYTNLFWAKKDYYTLIK